MRRILVLLAAVTLLLPLAVAATGPVDRWDASGRYLSTETTADPGRGHGPPEHAPAHGRRGAVPTAPFRVGAAAVSADPEPPYAGICLGGYGAFCVRPMEEVLHPLYARAIAITGEHGEGETLVLVTTTAAGLFSAYKPEWGDVGVQAVRDRVAERTGVPASNVVVQSDHSHAAPDTIGIWGGVTPEYMKLLTDAAVEAAVAAIELREPAALSVATVEGPPLRTLYDQPPTDRADRDFRVLFADSPEGHRVATFINYSPHATVLGNTGGGASGDWPAIASEIISEIGWGTGVATIGAIGATDWEERNTGVKNEDEARERILDLLGEAESVRQPVEGDVVGVESVFIREQLAQPVLAANLLPGIPGAFVADGSISMERSTLPPWLTTTVLGTVVSTARIGDVLLWSNPGEAFPQMQFTLRDGIEASAHFVIGAAHDFLGYMTNETDAYLQAFEAGTVFYLAGCPDSEIRRQLGRDGGCNDHWTLMVSPTIGTHVVCTAQNSAEQLGFSVDPGTRHTLCPALTATDVPDDSVLGSRAAGGS